jgi:hypothetical protein
MGKRLSDIVPDVDVLLSLAPEELAGVIIEALSDRKKEMVGNFVSELYVGTSHHYPIERQTDLHAAIFEAWA